MAALQMMSCLSPTPTSVLAASASMRPPPPSMLSLAPPRGHQHHKQHCFPGLTTTTLRRGQTAPAAVRRRCVRPRAQNRGGGQPAGDPPADGRHFVKEREHVMGHYHEIVCIDHGCLYMEATSMSGQLCLSADQALKMASHVLDSAGLNLGAPNEISTDTVHGTLQPYVKIFVDAADASYSRRVQKSTVMSFLGALRGLTSISHILLDDALDAFGQMIHPRVSLPEYAFNRDVKAMRDEFNQKMSDIEDGVRKASSVEIGKLAIPTISEAREITGSFVGLMVARRKRAIRNAQTQLLV